MSVKKYLFDYTDLTDFEKNVLKRLMPFYTWTRKNIPLQLEALYKQTGKVLPVEKIRQNLYAGADKPSLETVPKWAREKMPVVFGRKGNEVSYFPLESYLPFADISKVTRPTEIFSELLSPLIKVPAELASNRSWYFEQPIERYKGETKEFLKTDMPARVAYVLQQIRVLNEIHRALGYKSTSKDTPPQPSLGGKLTRFLTGAKVYKYDLEKSARSKIWDLRTELKALKIGLNRATKYGRIPEQKRITEKVENMENYIKSLTKKFSVK